MTMTGNKVLLVLASTLERSPYVNIYREVLDRQGVAYDMIVWDRNDDVTAGGQDCYVFKKHVSDNILSKVLGYISFFLFLRNHLRENRYNRLILFTIPVHFLIAGINGRFSIPYICDIRDRSRLCRMPFFKQIYSRIVERSLFTAISSSGYLSWLPVSDKYILSHNMTREMIASSACKVVKNSASCPIRILTIGQIRDYDANLKVVRDIAGHESLLLDFVGVGISLERLKNYVEVSKINNVRFRGRYQKSEEMDIVNEYNMMNIYCDDDINSKTLMSNRFYLSMLLKKPMIVADGTFQATLVEEYGLGIVVKGNENLSDKIVDYWSRFDYEIFSRQCDCLSDKFQSDIIEFEETLSDLLS